MVTSCAAGGVYKTVSPPCLHRRPKFRRRYSGLPRKNRRLNYHRSRCRRCPLCFYFCDGYAGTIAEDNAQWHRFLVKIRFICLTIANGADIFPSPLTTIALQVPVVTVVLKVICTLSVPVMAALPIPENKTAETDNVIKADVNFIVMLRRSALITRS